MMSKFQEIVLMKMLAPLGGCQKNRDRDALFYTLLIYIHPNLSFKQIGTHSSCSVCINIHQPI